MSQDVYYYDDQPRQLKNDNWPIVWVVIGILLFVFWSNGELPFQKSTPDQDQIVEPVDDVKPPKPEPQADKPSIKDTYVVRVFETQADQLPAWLVKQIQTDNFWLKWLKEQGAGLHTFDPMAGSTPNPQSESFVRAAKERGIEPPFWLHAQSGGKVLSITPFDKSTNEADWRRIIQEKVK